jgi:hypothetical protein
MSRFGGAVLVAAVLATRLAGCSDAAVGVEECRSIERARCSAALHCDVGITSKTEDDCMRFSRDNCLHGLASGTAPRSKDVDKCVAAIEAAGTCARRSGGDSPATDCSGLYGTFASDDETVCDIVKDPEDTFECNFLNEKPIKEKPVTDAGPG